ncbi:S-adenosylmethionine decarboxylase related protein [Ureibacillus sp. FSL K6-8385]|uniref:S-adenosylmethionine decarboxylase related protein n=1 Tax=Ureibacillus terrenus TaxID=118246 RepID=A0A540V1P8_9BACL|nr:S-adenosylmethionine decarboxylase related protein [Ureibacillus terrenus]MED3662021.1 S-adenosylmethionine decarboxylase related protein [Ureibacillus terrenus]MED3764700.1 S-adenosylmethionine decarboxylase related protein [Ureibacillus terrenus]TQE90647.1 S-adenosylmethionine decarboxylase related protein [Ureibacillus terrenus]
MKQQKQFAISLLGSMGGVAKAFLSILNRSAIDQQDPVHSIIKNSGLYLIDIKQGDLDYYKEFCPHLADNMHLLELDLNNTEQLMEHLRSSNTRLVVDVSCANTIDMLACCNQLGISYINTALENNGTYEGKHLSLTEQYYQFKNIRDTFNHSKAILFSGMNPGIVQWMAVKLMQKHSGHQPLACYIVEHDTSFYKDKNLIQPKTIYTTWSVKSFLEEAVLNRPMFVRNHLPHSIHDEVYAAEYKITLGDKEFYGCLVPHEEVLTLGEMFDFEIGFIYRINEYTTELIQQYLEHADELLQFNKKIIDPADGEVEGEDLIGVLMVYEDREIYMYNSMKNTDVFKEYKTNATYFQVACGVYAGMASLLLDDLPSGAFYVEELATGSKSNYGKYLTYYMNEFVYGENNHSDGLLHERMRKVAKLIEK